MGVVLERVDDERRRAPLLDRLGVPLVELVELVGVRRSEVWYCEGYWGYCECMVEVVELVATGKMPDEVVRVREWPSWVSLYWPGGGRTAMPGFAMGLRRTGSGIAPPYDGTGAGCAMAVCMMFARLCLAWGTITIALPQDRRRS